MTRFIYIVCSKWISFAIFNNSTVLFNIKRSDGAAVTCSILLSLSSTSNHYYSSTTTGIDAAAGAATAVTITASSFASLNTAWASFTSSHSIIFAKESAERSHEIFNINSKRNTELISVPAFPTLSSFLSSDLILFLTLSFFFSVSLNQFNHICLGKHETRLQFPSSSSSSSSGVFRFVFIHAPHSQKTLFDHLIFCGSHNRAT